MPFFAISLVIQVLLIVHIIKTGRDQQWIWVVAILPGAGSIAYLVLELLPDLFNTRHGRKLRRGVANAANPGRDMRAAERANALSDTTANKQQLGDIYLEKGHFQDAIEMYQSCLTGISANDPKILASLASAQYQNEDLIGARQSLEKLANTDTGFADKEAHLLYAKTLERLQDTVAAMNVYREFTKLDERPEAFFRYAMLLRDTGNQGQANDLLDSIIQRSQRAGKHFNRLNKHWIRLAREHYPV